MRMHGVRVCTVALSPLLAGNGTFHFKILVPAVAAGAIIGKGGETIALLQKEAGARVKMSKSNDFYPGEACGQNCTAPTRKGGL